MRNEILFGKVTAREPDGEAMCLEYYMVPDPVSDEYSDIVNYGVKIKQVNSAPGGNRTVEVKQIDNVFYRECDARAFMRFITKNAVTPLILGEVVEDYIAESVTL